MIGIIAAAMLGVPQPVWNRLADIPDKEGFASPFAGVSHGNLLVAGGANFPFKRPWEGGVKIWYIDVFALDKPGGEWRVVGKLPRQLGYGVSATYRNRVVCVGGSDAMRHYADAFSMELVDGRIETTPLPPLPIPIANACGTIVGDTLYVAGGQTDPSGAISSNRVFSIGLAAKTPSWSEAAGFPGPGRILATAASFDGAFWLIGGAGLKPDKDGKPVRTYLRDAYRFDARHGWRKMADLPYPVVAAPSPAPTSPQGIFILGGDDGSRVGTSPTAHPGFSRKVLRYDLASDKWADAGEMPVGRVTVLIAKWGNRWVLANGEQRPGVRSPEVWTVKF